MEDDGRLSIYDGRLSIYDGRLSIYDNSLLVTTVHVVILKGESKQRAEAFLLY